MMKTIIVILIALILGPSLALISGKVKLGQNYQSADRSSAHLAPDPATNHEAIVQIYAARAFNWRGLFGLHMWIAVKPSNAKQYFVYQVLGWWAFRGLPALLIQADIPDRKWFNQTPFIVADLRGAAAEKAIPEIRVAADSYPYADQYRLWPGPNSNTFVAYVVRNSPSLSVALPPMALGKDFLPRGQIFARAPSRTGYQFSIWGIFGILIAKKEGLEINLFGLVFGISPWQKAIALPGINQIHW